MDDWFDPVKGLIDVSHIQRSVNLLVLGLGRVGRAFILLAAHHGVRWIRAVDHDWVSRRNYASGFPESAVGTSKVAEMKEQLKRQSNRISFEGAAAELSAEDEPPNVLKDWIARSTHAALFIDDFPTASALAAKLYPDLPCVYTSIQENGQISEAAWSLPGQTPCLNCTAGLPEKQGVHGGQTMLVDVFSAVDLVFRQFLGLCLAPDRKGFDLFKDYVNPRSCLAIKNNRPGRTVDLAISRPDIPSSVRFVEVVDADGNGPSCSTCKGYRP